MDVNDTAAQTENPVNVTQAALIVIHAEAPRPITSTDTIVMAPLITRAENIAQANIIRTAVRKGEIPFFFWCSLVVCSKKRPYVIT